MEDLQSLLEKINRDGVEKAEAEAKSILADAKAKANSIIESARAEAAAEKAGSEKAAADYAALIGCFAQNDINGYLIANAYDPVANAGANTVSIKIGLFLITICLRI